MMAEEPPFHCYERVGVKPARMEKDLHAFLGWIERSFDHHPGSKPILKIGAYANVIPLPPPFGEKAGIAISTDGVGTKVLIAQMVDRYDTIGIDLVAMNANDVLCVGAEPLALVDCVSLESLQPRLLEQLGKGLCLGAGQAGISIPAGEIAQVRELVKGTRDGYGFDLVGTCVGIVALDRVIVGQAIAEGDVLLGLASSGVHSNGLTLARDLYFNRLGWKVDRYVAEFGRTLGEELLEPTRIYVSQIRDLLQEPVTPIKGLFHITGDGFLNLARAEAQVGFVIESLPDPPPVFWSIQERGKLSDAEMYGVFNMGIGFAVVVAASDADRVKTVLSQDSRLPAIQLGYAMNDAERKVVIKPKGLIGNKGRFSKS